MEFVCQLSEKNIIDIKCQLKYPNSLDAWSLYKLFLKTAYPNLITPIYNHKHKPISEHYKHVIANKISTFKLTRNKNFMQVYEELQVDGVHVDYERVPVTDEKSPKEMDFDILVSF